MNDFDFLIGSWRVHHRRLKQRLADNHEWIDSKGLASCQKFLAAVSVLASFVTESIPILAAALSEREVTARLSHLTRGKPEVLLLSPTARSLL